MEVLSGLSLEEIENNYSKLEYYKNCKSDR